MRLISFCISAMVAFVAIFHFYSGSRSANATLAMLSNNSDWVNCPNSENPGFDPLNPAEPNNSTFVLDSNCDFHLWAWQEFLYLTQADDTGQPRFLSMTPPSALVSDGAESDFLVRNAKTTPGTTVNEFLQAGPNGVMIDHNGHAIYYSQYLNDTFVDFLKTNFYNDNSEFDYHLVLQKVQEDPTIAFPDDAIELKVSWQIVTDGMNTSDFFTMPATVQKLTQNAAGKIVLSDETMDVTLRMVGFHIGAVVNGHVEMIWATFEQLRNAPDVFYANSATDFRDQITTGTVVSDTDYTFYKAGTQVKECNFNNGANPDLSFDVDSQTFATKDHTQVCRWYQSGDLLTQFPDQYDSINLSNVRQLNWDTLQILNEASNLWGNYFEVGAIWFVDPTNLKPGLELSDNTFLTGSVGLSNSTIETFTQVSSQQSNCFRCHNTAEAGLSENINVLTMPASNLNISHAFLNLYFWSQPAGGVQ